jgi:transposase
LNQQVWAKLRGVLTATLGASNCTYVEACENQRQESGLMAHFRTLEFFGGVPQLLIPDIRL